MKFLVIAAVLIVCDARNIQKRASDQNPKVWDALRILRGNKDLTIPDISNILENAVAGKDYPINAALPDKKIDCDSFHQPGFYADDDDVSRCQVFHRCDNNKQATSYLCPNQTLFNQITLICDWFYNVDCKQSKQFQDYSNSRLDDDKAKLLDDQMEYEVQAATGAVRSEEQQEAPKKKGKKKHRVN